MRFRSKVTWCFFALTAWVPATAQIDMTSMSFNTANTMTVISQNQTSYLVNQSVQNDSIRNNQKFDNRGNVVRNRPDNNTIVKYSFINSPARTQAYLNSIIARTRQTNPAMAPRMENFIRSTDVLGSMGQKLSILGLSRYNVADTFAMYWINIWNVARSNTNSVSSLSAQAVSNQVKYAAVNGRLFLNMNDAQKQEFAESMLFQTYVMNALAANTRGDPAASQRLAAYLRQQAFSAGLDLDAMTLTEQGFVPVGVRRR